MKTFILSIIVTMITSVAGAQQKSFYDFTVKAIDGKDLPLSTFKGKKVLVVNVASKCGFTPQYAKLEELLSLIHISEPTRQCCTSRMPSSA